MAASEDMMSMLYAEYERLSKEIEHVRSLILLKGGKLPEVNYELGMAFPKHVPSDPNYPSQGKWEEKIKYVLQVKGACFTDDIRKYIKQQEPNVAIDALRNAVAHYSSQMAAAGQIKAHKIGKKNKYSI